MNVDVRDALIRASCFHEAWAYAPTRAELIGSADVGEGRSLLPVPSFDIVKAQLDGLLDDATLAEREGRIGFPDTLAGIVAEMRRRDPLQPRKRRRARRVARWLASLSGVRMVALANTTALGNARDGGDIDFFVIVKKGTIWSTRLLGGAPFRLLRWTPSPGHEQDAVCLSYFIADDGLDLTSHQLVPHDPYFRHWFLSLLPIFDDGVSEELWEVNASLRARHPFALKWIVPPDLRIPSPIFRLPTSIFEPLARAFQRRWFPPSIRERMDRDTTVIVSDQALKFHVTDNRDAYRRAYEGICQKRSITP